VSWWDAVKWANARSESLGFTPCCYTDAAKTTGYRTGRRNVANDAVRWDADGFRLPTEAEWGKAARGGLAGQHSPWPSLGGSYSAHIDCSRANYYNCKSSTTPVGYYDGQQTPAGGDMANGYGLYDMAGNVWEWVGDGYGDTWYGAGGAVQNDTRGPMAGSDRVLRGGGWRDDPNDCRVANRSRNKHRTGTTTWVSGSSELSPDYKWAETDPAGVRSESSNGTPGKGGMAARCWGWSGRPLRAAAPPIEERRRHRREAGLDGGRQGGRSGRGPSRVGGPGAPSRW
jgi:hypothetical protein